MLGLQHVEQRLQRLGDPLDLGSAFEHQVARHDAAFGLRDFSTVRGQSVRKRRFDLVDLALQELGHLYRVALRGKLRQHVDALDELFVDLVAELLLFPQLGRAVRQCMVTVILGVGGFVLGVAVRLVVAVVIGGSVRGEGSACPGLCRMGKLGVRGVGVS